MIGQKNQESPAKTGRFKVINRVNHNAFTLYYPACFVFAIFRPFPTRVVGLPIRRCFSVETDNQVWENSVRCFMKNILKKQAEINDLRQMCFF